MGSKTDVVVKLTLVFFITLLSFSVGTFVGKKYSDRQHQLAALEPNNTAQPVVEREVASDDGTTVKEETSAQMTDEEIAHLAAEFATDDNSIADSAINPTASETSMATPHAAANAHSGVSTQPSGLAKDLAAGKTPQVEVPAVKSPVAKVENRVPSSLPKNVAQYSVGKFTVQVASFATETEAKAKAQELKGIGYSAFYIPAKVQGKTWYRVSVGQFTTQKEAQSYRSELLSGANLTSAIVQKITE